MSTTTVKKAKTAFQFYQAETIKAVKDELGSGTSMGVAMSEVRLQLLQVRLNFVF